MNASELIAEGKRLAKPCIYLRKDGEGLPVAAWGGPPGVSRPPGSVRHWLTLDCTLLPKEFGTANGSASVFSDEDSAGAFVVDPSARFSSPPAGVALFAHSTLSLPPIDAVFRFGSDKVHAWLAQHGWEPTWGHNDNFKDSAPVQGYEIAFQDQYPLYTGGAHAVLGGWHFPWPDDDWDGRLNETLVLSTFEDSEPWIEVWFKDGAFNVMQRIT